MVSEQRKQSGWDTFLMNEYHKYDMFFLMLFLIV
jgi:hypothetical protein